MLLLFSSQHKMMCAVNKTQRKYNIPRQYMFNLAHIIVTLKAIWCPACKDARRSCLDTAVLEPLAHLFATCPS